MEEIVLDDNNSVKLVNESKEKLSQAKIQLNHVKGIEFDGKSECRNGNINESFKTL